MSAAFCFCRENKYEKLQAENKHGHNFFFSRNYMKAEIYVLRRISIVRKASTKHSNNSVSLQIFCIKEERGEMLHLESSRNLFYRQ